MVVWSMTSCSQSLINVMGLYLDGVLGMESKDKGRELIPGGQLYTDPLELSHANQLLYHEEGHTARSLWRRSGSTQQRLSSTMQQSTAC